MDGCYVLQRCREGFRCPGSTANRLKPAKNQGGSSELAMQMKYCTR